MRTEYLRQKLSCKKLGTLITTGKWKRKDALGVYHKTLNPFLSWLTDASRYCWLCLRPAAQLLPSSLQDCPHSVSRAPFSLCVYQGVGEPGAAESQHSGFSSHLSITKENRWLWVGFPLTSWSAPPGHSGLLSANTSCSRPQPCMFNKVALY